ncbi:hypothetical protein MUCCIDRAFT_109701 [Mucor lusitanicus CBS 277.49]|uniref:Uncharacterized protein n=1 Tax=Mucor lusitanicus CBS 277.49 TaxID=747725 RepID=A0A168KWP0_MUCCL|nr:hypothetical protein MUCCIDRAFT_109701 [Mucor lusitanicus CBS 277.49]
MTHHNSRKSHRVYRSPSSPNEPSPYAKSSKDTMMEIDAKDEEAGTILMALSQHATRIRSHSVNNDRSATAAAAAAASAMAARSNSMSIRNLLVDNETSSGAEIPSIRPYQSVSTGYKPHYETRRKGFQICLTQRSAVSTDEDMYHHRRKQRSFSRYPIHHTNHNNHSKYHPVLKIRGNTAHIHISYRIHAHQASLVNIQSLM